MQVREKVAKSQFTMVFQWFVAPKGWKIGLFGAMWLDERWKSARRCGAKHIGRSECTKHTKVGAPLEVDMSKKCMWLSCEADFQVKMLKTQKIPHASTTLEGSDVVCVAGARDSAPGQKWAKPGGFVACHYTTLHSIPLRYTTLQSITLRYTTLNYTTLQLEEELELELQLYTTLRYTTLHYTPLHSTTLRYTLHYITPHYSTQVSVTLRYATLHCTYYNYITLHYTRRITLPLPLQIHYFTLNYTRLHYAIPHYSTLQYTTVHCTTLHYTTLHYAAYSTPQLQLQLELLIHHTNYATLQLQLPTVQLQLQLHYATLHPAVVQRGPLQP